MRKYCIFLDCLSKLKLMHVLLTFCHLVLVTDEKAYHLRKRVNRRGKETDGCDFFNRCDKDCQSIVAMTSAASSVSYTRTNETLDTMRLCDLSRECCCSTDTKSEIK